jgi:hypothetical protein
VLQAGFRAVLDAPTPEAQDAVFAALRANGGPRHERLVPQLVLLAEESRDTRTGMLPGVIVERLAIPAADVVAALVPLLASEDPARRAQLARMLAHYEDHSLERGADFSVYRPFLEGEPPAPLVRHLFAADPDAALRALVRAQVREHEELRALLWAWHELADLRWKLRFGFVAPGDLPRAAPEAAGELQALARHPRWWARLAAARFAADEPAARALVPLDALAADAHPLVREHATLARAEPR